MEIVYSKQAIKFINTLHDPIKSRIKKAIEKLPQGDIKKLKNAENMYRLRISKYRVIYYTIQDNTVFIHKIGLRGQIYNIIV